MELSAEESPVHPAAAAIWLAAALTLDIAAGSPLYRCLLLLAMGTALLSRPRQFWRIPLRGGAIAVITATAISAVLGHTGKTVLFSFPGSIPLLGGPVTAENIIFGMDAGVAIANAVMAVGAYSAISNPQRLVDIMPGALRRTGFTVASVARFLPAVVQNAQAIAEAQRMRGWKPRRIRGLGLVAAPVLVSAIEDSIHLAEVMEVRGYGSAKRTAFQSSRWNAASLMLTALAVTAFGLLLAATSLGENLNWYPFPALTLPQAAPWIPLAVLALAAPLGFAP